MALWVSLIFMLTFLPCSNTLLYILSDSLIENAMHIAAITISNCSQERDFSLLYTPPGKVNWCAMLESWMNSTDKNLRFSAKLITGNLSHVLESDQIHLLDLSSEELSSFLKLFCDAVNSETLTGSGFGCQFTAEELVSSLRKFLLSESNYFLISTATDIMPTSLFNLFVKGGNTIKQECCKVLLYLLNSSNFQKSFESLNCGLIINWNSDDPASLKFLKQLVHIKLQQSQG